MTSLANNALNFLIKYRAVIMGAICAIFLALYLDGCRNNNSLQDTYRAMADSLRVTEDALGRETAKISIITGNSRRDLLRIQSKDSTIKALQAMIKENRGIVAATILSNTTAHNIASNSQILPGDTVWEGDTIKIYPTYWTIYKNKWEDFNIMANRDTIEVDYKVFNHYEISQAYEKPKNGFFVRKVPTITIHNLNPNTITTELRSFTIKEKKRKVTLGAGVYGGLAIPTGQPTVIIGGGIQYNF